MRVTVEGGRRLREVAARVQAAASHQLRQELARAIREAAKPTLEDLKRTVRGLPIRGFPVARRKRRYRGPNVPKNLRGNVADATEAQIYGTGAAGVTFQVAASKMPASQQVLPRYMEDGARWRHPVMGNRHVWAAQRGKPWFAVTVTSHHRDFEARLAAAIDRVVDSI